MTQKSGIQTAMIMAAGYGSRLQNLTREKPKSLLKIDGYTLLDIQIRKLQKIGIRKIIINLHYFGKIIQEHLKENSYSNVEIIYSEEPEILGTGGGIAQAEKYFKDETIIVVNSDIISDISLQDFIQYYYNHKTISAITVWPSRNYRDYALVRYNRSNHLSGFLLKNSKPETHELTGIFMGYYILTPAARAYLKPVFSSVVSDFFQNALRENKRIDIFLHDNTWIDIGTVENYEYATQLISKGKINLDMILR